MDRAKLRSAVGLSDVEEDADDADDDEDDEDDGWVEGEVLLALAVALALALVAAANTRIHRSIASTT